MRRQARGFTLLEVVLAGAIFLMGMGLLTQLTRSVLESTAKGTGNGVQDSLVIDRYLQAQVALIKSYRTNAVGYVDDLPYGDAVLHIRQPIAPVAVVPGAGGYSLSRFEVFVELNVGGPVVGHTVFWKLGKDDGTAKAGV